MPTVTETAGDGGSAREERWPWSCLDCGGVIYHDGERCRPCEADHRRRRVARRARPAGFVDWMRRESVPGLSMKVSMVAGLELGLTAVWLRVLPLGSAAVEVSLSLLA